MIDRSTTVTSLVIGPPANDQELVAIPSLIIWDGYIKPRVCRIGDMWEDLGNVRTGLICRYQLTGNLYAGRMVKDDDLMVLLAIGQIIRVPTRNSHLPILFNKLVKVSTVVIVTEKPLWIKPFIDIVAVGVSGPSPPTDK